MFVNKISSGINHQVFKGYQHEVNNVGERVMRFNYPFDYDSDEANIEFYRVKKNPYAKYGYEVINEPIASVPLKHKGVEVNLQNITDLDKDEAVAYRIKIGDSYFADTGIKLKDKEETFTLITRNGTTPMIRGAAVLTMPDIQRPGAYYKGFSEDGTGEIVNDKAKQKQAEQIIRTFSNIMGGNLAGLELDAPMFKKMGMKLVFSTPIGGDDSVSSHAYWNQNVMQLADRMGTTENFASFARAYFKNGLKYVYDGTFTSEGLQGIHFQYALRWADKAPASEYWFRMSGIKDGPLGFGAVPRHSENLRHRVINPSVIFNPETKKVEENPNYKQDKETYFQIYDGSQVTEAQTAKLDSEIDVYKNLLAGNELSINSHDDTVISYMVQVDPKEHEKRLKAFVEYNKDLITPVAIDSSEGTTFIGQFSNFKIDKKTEGGFVAWDANTDMAKMNYAVSGYDEKNNQAIVSRSQRDYELQMQKRGAYEVQDMAIQAGRYWTRKWNDIQTIYAAQTLGNASTVKEIEKLINEEKLPQEVRISQDVLTNILDGWYDSEKVEANKDDITVKALMKLPLDTLEFGKNTVGVLSMPYFTNRATTEDTVGVERFDLMQQQNPHLVERYAKVYLKVNNLFKGEVKEFADEVIRKVNETSAEKLLEENGDYTEYGEYVINLIGQDIAKYAFLKSLTGDELKSKILPNGEITYDYRAIKEMTSLKSLGINAYNPDDEALQLERKIKDGLRQLSGDDVTLVAESVAKRINGTNVNSFRIAEAMVKNIADLGLAWRLDAAKDVMDQDAVRNTDSHFDEVWQDVVSFWKGFVQAVKAENPNSYIVAEITDMDQLMKASMGELTNVYDEKLDTHNKFKTVHDALVKFYSETGITSEAGYSYTFTNLLQAFSAEFEEGKIDNSKDFINRLHELLDTRGIDYIRNLYTFADNHDKPSVLHGMALDMGLFHSSLKNREDRIAVLQELTNSDSYEEMPLEAKLNVDNMEYFRTVSTRAVAMSKLMRSCINENLDGVASKEEIKSLKEALVDLTNGNYLGVGSNTKIDSINIPELSSLENALTDILKKAGIYLPANEFQAIIAQAKTPEFFNKYLVSDENKSKFAESILGKDVDCSQYSSYSLAIAALLKDSYSVLRSWDKNGIEAVNNAAVDFVKKFDKVFVEEKRTKLPFLESSAVAMKKNGYAARDFETVIKMLIKQAEYNSVKKGENLKISNPDAVLERLFRASTEPAVQKAVMYMTFLAAYPGIPTVFMRDMLGALGYDEKTKNVYLQNRNAVQWSQLEEGPLKEYRNKILEMFKDAFSIRTMKGAEPLNNGTPYRVTTTQGENDDALPAYLMQDAKGNMTLSIFNATGINSNSRVKYDRNILIGDGNEVTSVNNDNPYVPIQKKFELDNIILGAGLALPVGLTFTNLLGENDTAKYVVEKIGDKLGIVNKSGKIVLNGKTAKNGVMVLKHIAFKGRNINKQYNIVTNAYKKAEVPEEGTKLSIIAK